MLSYIFAYLILQASWRVFAVWGVIYHVDYTKLDSPHPRKGFNLFFLPPSLLVDIPRAPPSASTPRLRKHFPLTGQPRHIPSMTERTRRHWLSSRVTLRRGVKDGPGFELQNGFVEAFCVKLLPASLPRDDTG